MGTGDAAGMFAEGLKLAHAQLFPMDLVAICYLVLLLVALMLYQWQSRASDRSDALSPISITPAPDPCEIAYLRCGKQEAARVAVLALIADGRLSVRRGHQGRLTRGSWIVTRGTGEPRQSLSCSFEKGILRIFDRPKEAQGIYESALDELGAIYAEYDGRGRARVLLRETPWGVAGIEIGLACLLIIVPVIWLASLVTGARGIPSPRIIAVLVMTGTTLIAVWSTERSLGRLTKRGRRYLQDLQLGYRALHANSAPGARQLLTGPAGSSGPDGWSRGPDLLAVALSGMQGLPATDEYRVVSALFKEEPDSWSMYTGI